MRAPTRFWRGHATESIWAERLEAVRSERGYLTIRSFFDALCEVEGFSICYATARNYHTKREPSPSYLAAVCRRFDVSPGYLLLGEGEP